MAEGSFRLPGSLLPGPASGVAISVSPTETEECGVGLARFFPRSLVLLSGAMGTGKTIFAKGFARGLGIDDPVSSPTYTIMNVYGKGQGCLHHLDLYRIGCLEEVVDVGLFEAIEAGFPCLVEWAERVPELGKFPHLAVSIVIQEGRDELLPEEVTQPESDSSRLSDDEPLRRISWNWVEGA